MHLSSIFLLGVAVCPVAFAIPTINRHVVHEERSIIPAGWEKQGRLPQHVVLPVRIGLTQSNLDKAYDVLEDISNAESPNYGNHWTDKQISNFFAPSTETVRTVRTWLNSSGISSKRIMHSAGRGWLQFEATVAEMEVLLKTTYWQYKHRSGKSHLSCHEYSVPEQISRHIDFITPTIHFDSPVAIDSPKKTKRADPADSDNGMTAGPVIGKTVPAPPNYTGNANNNVATKQCGSYVTPACLRALYNMPKSSKNLSSFGIVEYYPQTFLQTDLNLFQASGWVDADVPVGSSPIIQNVDGGSVLPLEELTGQYLAESNLDLQYAMDLVWPQQVTVFQVGDNGTDSYGAVSFNTFLDAIDKAYCSYMGGDTYGIDRNYPDPNGYNHTADCGTWTPSSVISTSYGYNEYDLSPAYEARQCNEYMKLGLKGVSVIYSSGDGGVSGNGGRCVDSNTGHYTDGSYGRFTPLFPATCPYVTAVGATQLSANNTANAPEVACETVIYSGGGFSDRFALPKYQQTAVTSYFHKYNPAYTADQYNNSRTTRGFPDVSANGANYVVALDGHFSLVYGTSASAPTFGAIITMINNERIAIGKKTLGFLNPVLYQNPKMFNDITSGKNPGCGTDGFSAVPGWDPVTGLGTPDYSKLLKKLVKVAAK